MPTKPQLQQIAPSVFFFAEIETHSSLYLKCVIISIVVLLTILLFMTIVSHVNIHGQILLTEREVWINSPRACFQGLNIKDEKDHYRMTTITITTLLWKHVSAHFLSTEEVALNSAHIQVYPAKLLLLAVHSWSHRRTLSFFLIRIWLFWFFPVTSLEASDSFCYVECFGRSPQKKHKSESGISASRAPQNRQELFSVCLGAL